jgi:hypothetical protein
MAKVVIVHAVADLDRWKMGKQERIDAIGAVATGVTGQVAADGSNQVALTAQVTNPAGMDAMLSSPSPEPAAVMEKHGVVPPFTAYPEA